MLCAVRTIKYLNNPSKVVMEKEVIRFLTESECLEILSLSKMLLNLMNTQVSGGEGYVFLFNYLKIQFS